MKLNKVSAIMAAVLATGAITISASAYSIYLTVFSNGQDVTTSFVTKTLEGDSIISITRNIPNDGRTYFKVVYSENESQPTYDVSETIYYSYWDQEEGVAVEIPYKYSFGEVGKRYKLSAAYENSVENVKVILDGNWQP